MRRRSIFLSAAALSAGLLLASCSTPATRFYVLSTLPARSAEKLGNERNLAIGVGPIEFPDYLDRPQIVTRTGQNELELAEFDRWAESLKDNATQVLVENLATLLMSQRVVAFPWKRATPIDYQIAAKVLRFDYTQGGSSILSVRWAISNGDGTREISSRRSHYFDRPPSDDYAAVVASMNRVLAALSRDLATTIREIR